jgi:hypothetical protein
VDALRRHHLHPRLWHLGQVWADVSGSMAKALEFAAGQICVRPALVVSESVSGLEGVM